MPIKLSSIAKQSDVKVVTIDGEALKVEYNPSAITPEVQDEVTDDEGSIKPKTIHLLLLRMVKRWDLTYDDGSPVPLELEAVRQIPTMLLAEIVTQLLADIGPKEKTPVRSGSFSSQVAN